MRSRGETAFLNPIRCTESVSLTSVIDYGVSIPRRTENQPDWLLPAQERVSRRGSDPSCQHVLSGHRPGNRATVDPTGERNEAENAQTDSTTRTVLPALETAHGNRRRMMNCERLERHSSNDWRAGERSTREGLARARETWADSTQRRSKRTGRSIAAGRPSPFVGCRGVAKGVGEEGYSAISVHKASRGFFDTVITQHCKNNRIQVKHYLTNFLRKLKKIEI